MPSLKPLRFFHAADIFLSTHPLNKTTLDDTTCVGDPTQSDPSGDRDHPPASLPLKARLLNFLEERPGVPFEPEELASEFGGTRDAIRKTLDRLWRSGLVQIEERVKQAGKGNTKYKVYLVAEIVQRSKSSQGENQKRWTDTTTRYTLLKKFV